MKLNKNISTKTDAKELSPKLKLSIFVMAVVRLLVYLSTYFQLRRSILSGVNPLLLKAGLNQSLFYIFTPLITVTFLYYFFKKKWTLSIPFLLLDTISIYLLFLTVEKYFLNF